MKIKLPKTSETFFAVDIFRFYSNSDPCQAEFLEILLCLYLHITKNMFKGGKN